MKMHNPALRLTPYLGVNLHGEEEPETGVGSDGMQLLLKLDQPLWGQVHVLEQHPATCLGGRGDGLLCQTKPFGRTCISTSLA